MSRITWNTTMREGKKNHEGENKSGFLLVLPNRIQNKCKKVALNPKQIDIKISVLQQLKF